ncbi:MAG: gluconate 2-dehydrogenase subunit 3 family protein [Edaphobacter sp.]|uniref:gluconate 2-dehydrogenase subunit 3 family protein n=1 Tax=Edaphobacter sp. TaxID=1934404 RepID=UPI0023A5E15E|nr:gluconate 2-dehydrogenase subunit 3 family protein [Edaphobacter sp.]MDE1177422.1 gluconate 2-dehydrogenase subunit 3 family protein [Edaphobacter sp.]
MKRRDFVKGLAVATVTAGAAAGQQSGSQAQNPPPAPNATDQGTMAVQPSAASSSRARSRVEEMAHFHTPNIPVTQPDLLATTDARYFTAVRYATLVHLCEILMPAGDDVPSAIKAGTPEFLDFYIGASPADQQAMYNDGLDRLNADCLKQCSVPFAKADAKQADSVIRPHLRGWMNDHPPREGHVRFINLAHRDIRTATINSPAWAIAAEASGERTPGVGLYWHPIDPGIQTWVSHAVEQATPTNKHKHA